MNDAYHPPVAAPLLFQRLRGRLLGNSARLLLGTAGLRVVTILACSALVWACVYAGGYWGFQFIQQQRLPFLDDIVSILAASGQRVCNLINKFGVLPKQSIQPLVEPVIAPRVDCHNLSSSLI